MPGAERIKGRYELKENIGQGGMGVVYKAYDTEVGREVALKTIGDISSRAALDLFYKEWRVLANLHHPNIVEIYDIGEFQEGNLIKPFFVMPLLRGTTLDDLIHTPGQPLGAERVVEIMAQLCRGLHAAHEHGLVHRDLKPSNVFVMEYNSVKLIDFGVAHLVGGGSKTGLKGTVWYMAPEQIQNQECTPAVDIFSLGVLCYEALTGVRPFQGRNAEEIFEAILHRIPLPASDINPQVSQPISRVIHKALAKQPRHRYTTALQFAEILQKAQRNEYIEFFDPAHVQPRIQRSVRAYEQGNFQLAGDILSDVEAAGYIDPSLAPLRKQIDQALRRKTIAELLDRARSGIAEEEYTLAGQNIEELLKIDPANQEGLRLKEELDQNLGQKQIEDSLRAAVAAVNNHSYERAREILNRLLERHKSNQRAFDLLAQIDGLEERYRYARREKDLLYQGARSAWENCEFASAYLKLRRVLELEEQAPDTSKSETRSNYVGFFGMVEAAHNHVETAVTEYYQALRKRDFARAEQICNENLGRYPGHELFEGLRMNLDEARAFYTAEQVDGLRRRALQERDYEARLSILRDAAHRFPDEPYFEASIHRLRERAIFAKSMIAKARLHEQQGEYEEALERWRMLKRTDPHYAGVDDEIERLSTQAPRLIADEALRPKPAWVLSAAAGAPGSSAVSLAGSAAAPDVEQPAEPLIPGPAAAPRPAMHGERAVQNAPEPTREAAQMVLRLKITERLSGWWTGISTKFSDLVKPIWNTPATTGKQVQLGVAAAMLILAISVSGFVVSKWGRKYDSRAAEVAAPVVAAVPVTIESATPAATIYVDRKAVGLANPTLVLKLNPGSYEIEAKIQGRKPWSDRLVVTSSETPKINVPALAMLPQTFRVVADFENGHVWLDNKRMGALKESQFTLEDLPPGKHYITVGNDANAYVTLNFEVVPGSAPAIAANVVKAPQLSMVAVSGLGDQSRLYTNTSNSKYSVDGGGATELPAEGVELTGSHQVVINEPGKDPLDLRVETSPAPTLIARIYSDRNVGTVVITVPGTEAFQVMLDGKEKVGKIQDGKMKIPGLAAKTYTLGIRAAGFEDFEDKVTVRKGQELPFAPPLKALPQAATLKIEGAQPEAQVFIDGAQVGKVSSDGSFSYASVAPGDHDLALKKPPAFKDKQLRKSFKVRSTVGISGSDVAMERLPATVVVNITAGAKGSYRCSDGTEHEISQSTVTCKDGPAVFRATRPEFEDDSRELTLAAGVTYNVTLNPKAKAEATRARLSCGAEQLSGLGWAATDSGHQLRGSASLPCAGRSGLYQLTLFPPKSGRFGSKKTSWTIPGIGTFTLDKKSISGPSGTEDLKKITQSDGSIALQIDMSSARLSHAVKQTDGNWKVLGVNDAGGTVPVGAIRFTGEATLANFTFAEK